MALGLARGLSNRQISREMFLAEKTVKNMVSSILDKLGMARRTEVAVLVAGALNSPEVAAGYRSCGVPDLIAEITASLTDCISDDPAGPRTSAGRAAAAVRLAAALDAARTDPMGRGSLLNRRGGFTPGPGPIVRAH